MHRTLFFLFASVAFVTACSGRQDLGGGGSRAGESCSKSADCVDGLRCTSLVCGGPDGTDRISAPDSNVTVGPGSGPRCDTDATCAARSSSGPYCKQGGDCTECLTDDHCALKSSGHHCKVTTTALNLCTECLVDAHCTDPAAARCSEGKYGNYCVACLADADCKDPTQSKCEITQSTAEDARSGYCKGCLANADCKDKDKPICRIGSCHAP